MHKSYAFNFDNLNSDILSRLINHASELGGNEVTPVSALGRILELPCSHFFGDSLGVGSASGMSRKSPPPPPQSVKFSLPPVALISRCQCHPCSFREGRLMKNGCVR